MQELAHEESGRQSSLSAAHLSAAHVLPLPPHLVRILNNHVGKVLHRLAAFTVSL